LSTKAGFDVAQALAKGQLRKGHAKKLVQTRKRFYFALALIPGHTAPKRRERKMLRQLCENQRALIHGTLLQQYSSQGGKVGLRSSNRDQKIP
jgi:hypothetical protein